MLCRSYIMLNRQIFQLFNQRKITDTAVLIRSKHAWNHKQHYACEAYIFQGKKIGVKFQRGTLWWIGKPGEIGTGTLRTLHFGGGLSKCLLCGVQTNYRLFLLAELRLSPWTPSIPATGVVWAAAVIHQSKSGWSGVVGRITKLILRIISSLMF